MREASDSEPSSQSIDAEGLAFIIPHVYGQLNQTVTFTDSYKQHSIIKTTGTLHKLPWGKQLRGRPRVLLVHGVSP